jgi:hypothetical protein
MFLFVVFSLSGGNPAGRRNGDEVVGEVHKDVRAAPVPEIVPVLCTVNVLVIAHKGNLSICSDNCKKSIRTTYVRS